jgi:ERCC4-type nuclease
MEPFSIIIDSREKNPFFIDKIGDPNFPDLKFRCKGLKTGDYSLENMDSPDCTHSIAIERKELSDLFGSTGRNRDRFLKEFERLALFDYAALIIESDFNAIFKTPPPLTMMKSKSVFRTLLAFCQRYHVQCFPCPNRAFAEKTTYLLLHRFYTDRQREGALEFCKI